MSQKDDYTDSEWTTLLRVLLDTPTTVMLASPGGIVGESIAVVQAFGELKQSHADILLIQALITNLLNLNHAETNAVQQREGGVRPFEEVKRDYLATLRRARFIVAEKGTPDEQSAFKASVVYLAEHVAQASKEGGFLGIGSTRYTETEQRLVDDIRGVLGL